jgi:hypothetical protein
VITVCLVAASVEAVIGNVAFVAPWGTRTLPDRVGDSQPAYRCSVIASGIAIGLVLRRVAGPRVVCKPAGDNLFLRAQLTALIPRGRRAPHLSPIRREFIAVLSRFTDWREALYIVKPETLVRWHRDVHRLLWRRQSRPGPAARRCPRRSSS